MCWSGGFIVFQELHPDSEQEKAGGQADKQAHRTAPTIIE
jgi:hypothetical protein